MKRTNRTIFVTLLAMILFASIVYCSAEAADSKMNLNFDKYYIIMPKLDIRADPYTPGAIDSVCAGQEVDLLYTAGNYSQFNYLKDDELRTGATWTGAIAPGIRIHLLDDAFIFHRPGQDRTELASISSWREPTDPDLLILWEEDFEGKTWLYILSLEDCRAGYMKGDVPFEIVE